MSLLTICQDASNEIGISQPSSLASSTNPESQKLLRYAKKVGSTLAKGFPWQILRKEATFTSIGNETQTSILPSDFDRFVAETFWNKTDKTLMIGPISAVEWNSLKANAYDDDSKVKYVLRGDSILTVPAMTAGKSLAFEYVSTNWCQSLGGVAQSTWVADTDTGILNEELITRGVIFEFLWGDGLPADVAYESFDQYYKVLMDNDNPDADILVAGDIFKGNRHFIGTP